MAFPILAVLDDVLIVIGVALSAARIVGAERPMPPDVRAGSRRLLDGRLPALQHDGAQAEINGRGVPGRVRVYRVTIDDVSPRELRSTEKVQEVASQGELTIEVVRHSDGEKRRRNLFPIDMIPEVRLGTSQQLVLRKK